MIYARGQCLPQALLLCVNYWVSLPFCLQHPIWNGVVVETYITAAAVSLSVVCQVLLIALLAVPLALRCVKT